ncbi:MAG: hypothetical protein RR540_03975, partial [Oscillospiraceae bacterium]
VSGYSCHAARVTPSQVAARSGKKRSYRSTKPCPLAATSGVNPRRLGRRKFPQRKRAGYLT